MKVRWVLAGGALVAAVALGLTGCEWLFGPSIPGGSTLGVVPQAGAVHTEVTLVGAGFGPSGGGGTVTFDGVEATIVTWTDTNIVVRVPVLATPAGRRGATIEVRGLAGQRHVHRRSRCPVRNGTRRQLGDLRDESGRNTAGQSDE